ncbi:threonine efflux protein [Corynebacterium kutscheri]|uniref:Threonine efflux protein n=1 Tax=Corynebacterium kutscheri TaxID=35755 RepID=A0A0F6QZ40_9CORY|nr:LysE family translocator [Corynebacterium kutscheri]AKE40917.1 putative threonine efflux protein [Corynebacterium kutscheri]VEH06721.1 threonine efflux protein [Corynebacterium kutscheri]VEH09216.1 threonine efflux protein [Corynebacterium kutscheri]VEH79302.1 threonine efflux protein [Corynebacterium kutscheri]
MTLEFIATLIGLNLLGMITPGPDIFLITRLATRSRVHAFAAIAGISTGVAFWVSLTVFGAAALIQGHPTGFRIFQIFGAIWLLWLAWSMLRAQPASPDKDINEIFGTPRISYRQGLLTNLSNPKIVLYFAAIIAPVMPANPSLTTALIIIAIIVSSSIVGFGLLAALLSTTTMQRRFLAFSIWIDRVAGVFFLIAGSALLVTAVLALAGIG